MMLADYTTQSREAYSKFEQILDKVETQQKQTFEFK